MAQNPIFERQEVMHQGVGRRPQRHLRDSVRPGRGRCRAQGSMDLAVVSAQHLQDQNPFELTEREHRPRLGVIGAPLGHIGGG